MIIINKSVSAVTEMSHKGKQMTSSNQRKKKKKKHVATAAYQSVFW